MVPGVNGLADRAMGYLRSAGKLRIDCEAETTCHPVGLYYFANRQGPGFGQDEQGSGLDIKRGPLGKCRLIKTKSKDKRKWLYDFDSSDAASSLPWELRGRPE